MTTFIEFCACRGRRPDGVVSLEHMPRNDLVAKLVKDRRIPRFIIGPTGFGKSTLAFEYASLIFSFRRTFWINGKSPCFLRDLDEGQLLEKMEELESDHFLVVFEDVPLLNEQRCGLFEMLITRLSKHGHEVICTCSPAAGDPFLKHEGRMILQAGDLMLTPEECEACLSRDLSPEAHGFLGNKAGRVPCLCLTASGSRRLVEGLLADETPDDHVLAALIMLLLEEGKTDDLGVFTKTFSLRETVPLLARWFPFLGIDEKEGTFSCVPLDVEQLAPLAATVFDRLAKASLLETRDALAGRLGDALLARRQFDKAGRTVGLFASKSGRAAWLSHRGWEFVEEGQPLAVVDMYQRLSKTAHPHRSSVNTLVAWAYSVLGEPDAALRFAKKTALAPASSPDNRALSALLLLRTGSLDLRRRGRMALEGVLAECKKQGTVWDDSVDDREEHLHPNCEVLTRVGLALDDGLKEGIGCWCDMLRAAIERKADFRREKALAQGLTLAAAWVADKAHGCDNEAHLALIGRFVANFLEDEERAGRISWYGLRASRAFDALQQTLSALVFPRRANSIDQLVHQMDRHIAEQREAYRRQKALLAREADDHFRQTHNLLSDSLHKPSAGTLISTSTYPTMHVSLFGGFEVRLGDAVVDPSAFKRQKAKTLLALLVLNKGKEFSRDKIIAMLWPSSKFASGRKNFYSVWTQMTNALSVDGTCPYLIRNQFGCRVNSRLVTSDVLEFESLCRSLMFGKVGSDQWERVLEQVGELCAGDLMPSESYNELILDMRDACRLQLVDAMLSASSHLLKEGETRGALWFARSALNRDPTREDAYAAQMEAQIAAEQRGSALETYFACRRYLAEELGIDPSPRIVNLYRTIIETEESID